MHPSFKRTSGISLIIGSLLLMLTMVLHPVGGSIEHIIHIAHINRVSHSLAIACLPFIGFGYYGLALALNTENKLSILALVIAGMGLVAGMIAASINGLTLSEYLLHAGDTFKNQPFIVDSIAHYSGAINHPMAYILMCCLLASMGIWSVLILLTQVFPKWLGYLGLALVVLGGLGFAMQFQFIHVSGFRVFIAGLLTWIVGMGIYLMRK